MQTTLNSILKLSLLGAAGSVLLACSQKAQDINDLVKVAALGYPDVTITQAQVTALPYAAIQLKWGQGPRVLSTLAFAEDEELKWVTQDKAMVVTQHGRLVRTAGFAYDITHTANLVHDPLPQLLSLWQQGKADALRWSTEHDWQPGYYSGYQALSRFTHQGSELVTILDTPVSLIKFTEQVVYPKLNIQQENTFWLSPSTGKVIKSQQYIGPGLPAVEITLLKPYQS